MEIQPSPPPLPGKGFSGMQVLTMVGAATAIAILVTFLLVRLFLFPAPFTPVLLTAAEENELQSKLTGVAALTQPSADGRESKVLQPERYSEAGLSREISFSERELNALIAKNTDLADKLAIDLAENLISIKLLLPLDPDLPVLGGQTLKITAGAELAYRSGRPVAKLHGVSVMGLPMPNSWLGGIKNVDLVEEFGADPGFWQAFADGVEAIGVGEGLLTIRLRE